ncbi:MAG: sulfurtransferase-like selenium metabolism protein YedF [Bacteroidota bacterium]
MKTIDTKGYLCPQPLIMVKEGLLKMAAGEKVCIYTDNDTSLKNLLSYLKDQGVEPEVSSKGKVHTLVAVRPDESVILTEPAAYCETGLNFNDYVVCIRGELMGDGDPELGKVLMETFVDNLKLQEQLPTHVVLYNGGVKLAMKQSPVCSSLSELEEMGTRIMLCGYCIDHYGLQYDIGVGMISNMVVITETLASAGHVVNP